jgi:hypothetical protein
MPQTLPIRLSQNILSIFIAKYHLTTEIARSPLDINLFVNQVIDDVAAFLFRLANDFLTAYSNYLFPVFLSPIESLSISLSNLSSF